MYVFFAFALDIDEDVIEIHHHKNVKFCCQDLVDVTLKCGWYVDQSKRLDLIFEVIIAGPEDCLLFITFPDHYSMVGISQIELVKMLSLT